MEAFVSKNGLLPLIFFSLSKKSCQDLLLPYSYKPSKNIFVLVGTVIKKPEFLGLS